MVIDMIYYYLKTASVSEELDRVLFEPVEHYRDMIVNDLIRANNEIQQTNALGFRHLSEFYFLDGEELGSERYGLPHLDPTLFDKFIEFFSFKSEWDKKKLYVSQFLKKALMMGLHCDPTAREDREVDLGSVLPEYLLRLTKLYYTEGIYKENPALHNDWEKIKAIINELLALRMVIAE